MKRIYFLILIGMLGAVLPACKHHKKTTEEVDTWHKKRPKAPPVKTVKTYETFFADSVQQGGQIKDTLVQVEEFDKNDHKTHMVHYTEPRYEIFYTSDANGNYTFTRTVYPDKSEATETRTYDKDNHPLTVEWKNTESNGKHVYTYDEYGNMSRWDWYEKGQFVVSRLYPNIYDDNGHILESFYKETRNNRDTSLMSHEAYDYDSVTGKQTHKVVYMNNSPLAMEEYFYNKSRDRIMEVHYELDTNGEGKLVAAERVMNTYNEYGELTQTKLFRFNQLQYTTDNTYDQYGHLILSEQHFANGTTVRTRYEYTYQ
jgi:hypothetical protein